MPILIARTSSMNPKPMELGGLEAFHDNRSGVVGLVFHRYVGGEEGGGEVSSTKVACF